MCGRWKMQNRSKLAIFDMDGTLFDTKNVNYEAYCRALKECGYDVKVDYTYYCNECNGLNYRKFLPMIIHDISAEDMEKIHERKKAVYAQFLDKARVNQHLFDMMNLIRSHYVIALVTTASRRNVSDILKIFQVEDYFDFLITQEDVENTKPDPQCFIKAMAKAGVDAKDTIIFEDSDVGIRAAELSGAHYVKVYGYN